MIQLLFQVWDCRSFSSFVMKKHSHLTLVALFIFVFMNKVWFNLVKLSITVCLKVKKERDGDKSCFVVTCLTLNNISLLRMKKILLSDYIYFLLRSKREKLALGLKVTCHLPVIFFQCKQNI